MKHLHSGWLDVIFVLRDWLGKECAHHFMAFLTVDALCLAFLASTCASVKRQVCKRRAWRMCFAVRVRKALETPGLPLASAVRQWAAVSARSIGADEFPRLRFLRKSTRCAERWSARTEANVVVKAWVGGG